MDHLYSTTSEHRNGQHLSFEHRLLIQTRLKSGWSYNKIAKEIDFISFVEKKFLKTDGRWMIRVPGRDLNGVMAALKTVRSRYSEH